MSEHIKQPRNSSYWRFSSKLVVGCLLVWLFATLLPLALAQAGVTGTILGWPIVFALAAFGVPVAYLVIIGVYSFAMDRVERRIKQNNHDHE